MDIPSIHDRIEQEIQNLETARNQLALRADDKAKALGNYELKLAKTMIALKNGLTVELDGEEITYTSATGLEKIAKGVCFRESIELDLSETRYKSAVKYMDASQAIINALQSILRGER